MEINAINAQLAQAVSALKASAHAAASPGVSSKEGKSGDFLGALDSALKAVSRDQQSAAELQRQFQLENPNVSLEETMLALSKSQITFQAAVQVRNRLTQAYEQIMNMPV